MDVRFEDHGIFQRSAALCALGGAALGATGSLPLAALGSSLAMLLLDWRRRRIAAACATAAMAVAWALAPLPGSAAATGAMLGLLLAVDRDDRAREEGAPPPSPVAILLAASASAASIASASLLLPALSAALSQAVPAAFAAAAAGAALGLWAALSAAPLHVRIGGDPIDARLAALRFALGPELRALAERAVAARNDAVQDLPPGTPPELRASLDALAAAALELASRAAGLGRSASARAEDELQKRVLALRQGAKAAEDPAARQSYENAAEALGAQLEHLRRVRRARERTLARLHEDVANLERARFSLTLHHGPELERELTELQETLRARAADLEEPGAPVTPLRARA